MKPSPPAASTFEDARKGGRATSARKGGASGYSKFRTPSIVEFFSHDIDTVLVSPLSPWAHSSPWRVTTPLPPLTSVLNKI
ncbi:hypothetical protein Taro_043602 [Colocasia esculenta]|uniref:Uncharacterized protein n=1 Tax=Colocasia esculenta TaxID=4460 RepID=A0A843X1U5_COLES|nr:hypothetical protein [Colocasia esculenta]